MTEYVQQFQNAIADAGLTPPFDLNADGRLHRFSTNGKEADDSGWYCLFTDGVPGGSFGDWRTGLTQTWRGDIGRELSCAELAEHRSRIEAIRRQREEEEMQRRNEAKAKALAIWQRAEPASDAHPYLVKKGIKANGARCYKGALVIPMLADGEIQSLQFISKDGEKRFLSGGRVKGCFFSLGTPNGAAALSVAEGFATSASIHEATGLPVAVAFNAGNVGAVAKAMRDKFPVLPLILCADDDTQTDGNPGMTAARASAQSVGGRLAVPDFGPDRPDGATDFNDLAAARGLDAVARCINAVARPDGNGDTHRRDDDNAWPEPVPMHVKLEAEEYPLDALPDSIRLAVEEVAGFVKAPIPLVAACAVSAVSLAAQAHVDAKRAEGLQGPSSLFMLSIADSGERKSTCDGFFTRAIRDYEKAQAELAKPFNRDYRAKLDAWEAKRAGVREKIRQLAKNGEPTGDLERRLGDLENEKPEPPRVPRLVYADATPEALAYGLAKQWPSVGVVSAEAGIVFGSHGMSSDSVMRNLAQLNQLWDGNSLQVDRRSAESFVVRGARLTMALQVQEPTLRDFFARSGALARGTGFLARFLVAWPKSTQGTRSFREPPANWPQLTAFNNRLAAILDQQVPMDDDGALTPAVMSLSPAAKTEWIYFHDTIEAALSRGEELHDVRDVASKTADNAVRLAALFHCFSGEVGQISADTFERASRIAVWHLLEARRFLGELTVPADLADAARLDVWLIEYCQRKGTHIVSKRHIRQHGPIRDGNRLDAALRELEEMDRLRIEKDSKRISIWVNPSLVRGKA